VGKTESRKMPLCYGRHSLAENDKRNQLAMTQEDKQLLLKDLAARLPYGVKMRYKDDSGYEVLCQIDTFYKDIDGFNCLLRTTGPYGEFQDLNELKPYLRPMSSMTEEERDEYHKACTEVLLMRYRASSHYPVTDWLLAHHFDYRGLIEKELALEAPEGMYKMSRYDHHRTNKGRN
jgi:hypothetical protein